MRLLNEKVAMVVGDGWEGRVVQLEHVSSGLDGCEGPAQNVVKDLLLVVLQ